MCKCKDFSKNIQEKIRLLYICNQNLAKKQEYIFNNLLNDRQLTYR